MSIIEITETPNTKLPKFKPVKENMSIFIPGVSQEMNIPCRNGFIWLVTGSPGSGKSNLCLNFFKNRELYRCKFDNIFYFCPESSFLSVERHPFASHDKVYHELTASNLDEVFEMVREIKAESESTEYNLVFIDDFADQMKDASIVQAMAKFLIKSRHLQTAFIITLQSYYLFPKQYRKIISNVSIFKPKNYEEWESIAKEMFNLKKQDALKLYNYVYDRPYTHLDVDLIDNSYYKNFCLLQLKTPNPHSSAISTDPENDHDNENQSNCKPAASGNRSA